MLLSFILASIVAATPAPSLQDLRVIANVRSTPACSILRTHIGPAIAALLDNDATMDKARETFRSMYRHRVLSSMGDAWSFIDRGHLEYTIGPLAKNIRQIDEMLHDAKTFHAPGATAEQTQLLKIRNELNVVLEQQKTALNVISGYDATDLAWDILSGGINQQATRAIAASKSGSPAMFDSSGFFAGTSSSQVPRIPFQGPRSSPGRMDVSLAYNPYRIFSDSVLNAQTAGIAAENAAAADIQPLLHSCTIGH